MHSSKTCVDKYVWRTIQTSGTLNLLACIILVTLSFLLFICTMVQYLQCFLGLFFLLLVLQYMSIYVLLYYLFLSSLFEYVVL